LATRAAIIANPKARRYSPELLRRAKDLLEARGIAVSARESDAPGRGADLARRALADGVDVILVAGGDGMLNEVANGMAGTDVPLAIIPAGTTNVLAKEIGLSSRLADAVSAAVDGMPRRVSLGKAGDRHFLLMAGIGFDAEVVRTVNLRTKAVLGKAAYIAAGLRVLARTPLPTLTVIADGRELTGRFVVISNARFYAGPFAVASEAGLERADLDVCVFSASTRASILRYAAGVLCGRHLGFRDVTCLNARQIEVSSDGESWVQADGDLIGNLPMRFEVVPDALALMTP